MVNISGSSINTSAAQIGVNAVEISTSATSQIVDAVWDEVLTGATHNVASSAGRRLRQLASQVVWDGIAQGAGINGNQIQLDTGASSVNGEYDPSLIAIVNGTGAGQCRLILEYSGSARMATVDRDWKVAPSTDSEFIIYAHPGREHVNEGLAQAGATSTITLNANASSLDDNYIGQLVFLRSGTGQDQVRMVIAYNGTTKVATVSEPWGVIPDTTSAYVMLPTHIHEPSEIATAVAADILITPANKLDTDTLGGVNIGKVYSVSAAAQKLSISAPTMITGIVTSAAFAPTTTQFECADITDAGVDFYKYRTAIVTSGNINRQARNITAYSKVGSNGRFTVDAFTEALAHGDSIIIV
jgi:hypothetical protein